MNHRIDIDIGAASIQRACLLMAGLAVAWVAPGNANRRSDPKGSVHMSRPTPSRSHNARTAGRALSALALSLGLCGNAQAQSQPAVDVEVMRTPALMQPKGPADGGQVSFQCVNQGTAIATRVSCAAVMQMRDNDGSIVEVMPNDMRCTQGATQSAVVAPFTLQPNGSDGDTVWCNASAPYGGQLGGADFPYTESSFLTSTSAENESPGWQGNNTWAAVWVPIYDAISDSFTHVAGASQSYDLLANDQAGKASPIKPYDPANPQAVRWGSVCMFQTANGYRSDVVDPSALTYHSSVFTMPKAYALPADLSFALPLGVVLNRNGLMDVPASLPPGEYDLFYVYGTGAGEQTMPDGYVNDGSVYYGASLGCDPLRDYASVKLRVVAPAAAPVSVPTLEFGALIALGALVGAAGLRRQRRRG